MGASGGRRGERARREAGGVVFKLLIFLVVLTAFAALAWMLLLPFVVTARIRERTGFEATVQRVVVNPLSGEFDLRGLVLRNPAEFPVREFVELKTVRGHVRVGSLWSERTEFDAMTIEVGTITLVKAPSEAINAEVFERNVAADARKGQRAFLVHELRLRVERLIVVDHSGRQPAREERALAVEQVQRDVTSVGEMFTSAALRPLAPVVDVLFRLVPGELGVSLDQAAKTGAELLKEAGRKTGEGVKGFFDALEESKKP
jgi:hypothetical protein